MRLLHWLRSRPDGFWVVVVLLAVLVACGAVTAIAVQRPGFRDWLIADDSGSTTIRNLGLLVGGIVAIALAVWRSRIAERQAATSERGLLNERYQKGVEALASTNLSERLGAVHELQRLADEHPEQYHVPIMRRFCDIVCNPIVYGAVELGSDLEGDVPDEEMSARKEVQAIIEAIGTRNDDKIALERQANYRLNLTDADLRGHYLHNLNLSGSLLTSANLSNSFFFGTNVSGASMYLADLSGARVLSTDFTGTFLAGANLSRISDCHGTNFSNANLTGANLTGGNLSGAIMNGAELVGANLADAKFWDDNGVRAEGLTQRQIAFANATPEDKPPQLEGLEDADTGELISWGKRPKIV